MLPPWCRPSNSGSGFVADKLTRAKVEGFLAAGVPEGRSEAVLWDARVVGLGLRMRPSGAASWLFNYRPKGAGRGVPSRKITLGSWPGVALEAARAAARVKAGEVATGADPVVRIRAVKAREKNRLGKVLDGYEANLRQRKIVNAATIMSTLRRGLAPLLNREISEIERRDFVALVDGLEADGKPGAAQDLRKHARSLLEFAVTKGLAKYNVLSGMRRQRASRAERLEDESKGKALSDEEISALWRSAGSLGPFGGLVRLAVLSGLRRSELSGLKWSDVDEDRIVVHAERAKTGASHEVPLTALMRTVLDAQPRTTSALVFPGRGGVPMTGWSKTVPAARAASGVRFGLHDLRRTARTLMSRLGVPEDVAELAIGHVRRGLLATYNKDDAWAARVAAFGKVSAHVARCQAP
jgi:integrase